MPTDTDLRERAKLLKSQLDALYSQRDILNQKVNDLTIQVAANAGGAFGFQLKQDLQAATKERETAFNDGAIRERFLKQELKNIDADGMYRALLELNYTAQTNSFESYVESQRIAAFLIHGQTGYGQDWLLRRLLEIIPDDGESEPFDPIKLDLGSTNNKSVASIWKHIAERAGANQVPPLSNAEIAKAAAQWLETHTVVIIFRQIDAWTQQQMDALIETFWKELVTAAQATLKGDVDTRLLLFLVDYSDQVSRWNLPLHDIASTQQGEPSIPVRLQDIGVFTLEFIRPWLANPPLPYRDLFKDLRKNFEQSVQTIMQNSQGVPDEVARYICYQCQLDYDPERWLQI